ncbi:bifunctional DNA-formamidopyrimidine glycosylase/DNA-(apurinic or apyrimidinic site) lyase [Lichenihabitans psoromatis]|uniref:bifunctional DNA-formamidopyrimidine glycosylase/DNA-(apurinic or apyrimidinic site) lyase n=1 Tax=Lichenihabitans psoromatis TaxID=2528642 RepID=UPI001038574B|nr:bifunctional DNA-formamidopyrimidine glycosylase/DNA-(apurinic or apyrimidinic site) lyase [Lichenihabitans psoromatis]
MPELPEVETVRRGLASAMEGEVLARVTLNRPDLRFPFPPSFIERLQGRRLISMGRRAKYLLAELDDGLLLAMHLGMTGSFRVRAPGAGGADTVTSHYYYERNTESLHDHVRFDLGSGMTITYNDPRRFGFMTLVEPGGLDSHPLFRGIGVEPLSNAFDGATLSRLMAGKSTSLKAALLDQTLIAGLGNIYVCESLHRARLSPRRMAGTLARKDGGPTARAERLSTMIRDVLNEAVEAGGSSLRDYRHTDGALGTFQHGFRAYDREGEPCTTPSCRGMIRRIVQSGRSTFFCAECQR